MALGRLADTNKAAGAVLERRSVYDSTAFMAAWEAHGRGAAWGTSLLRGGLVDPARAELAVQGIPRKEPKGAVFIPDIEQGVSRLAAGSRASALTPVLASMGRPAHQAVERRLLDPKTRGAMCDGIGGADASADAKTTLLAVPVDGRDHASCVQVVLRMAAEDDAVLGWLGVTGEPGLLSQVGKGTMPCARVVTVWKRALTERGSDAFAALTVPLASSVRRCAPELDALLAEILKTAPLARASVVNAVDPYGAETVALKQTCKVLGQIAQSTREPHAIVERADNAVHASCKHAKP